MTKFRSESALLMVAHGSTVNPDSSARTIAHGAEIRRRKDFADVSCAFWKEEPSLRDALFLFDPESIYEVYVMPNFISEAYFTQTVLPRELELNGRSTKLCSKQSEILVAVRVIRVQQMGRQQEACRLRDSPNALYISAIASTSVSFPHQPVEIVHKLKANSQ